VSAPIALLPALDTTLTADVCQRATRARDPRFDGLFFVGITTTGVYCRPVCPSRVTYPDRRRFFTSAAAAERAGYRPCLRCRPELAPGRALCDAVSQLAALAAHRITAGALNGRSVEALAREFGVSERHLRRALERELGVSPVELAQTHRLLFAKRLLADTDLPVTRVAFASGFQSLRRFNTLFHERYGMAPSVVRWARPRRAPHAVPETDLLRLTLAYRPPFAWDALLAVLRRDALQGVEMVEGRRYGRTVRLDEQSGVVLVEDAGDAAAVHVDVSPLLEPALMPLLARLRQFFDLDAQPTAVDAHLAQTGLGDLVRARPGLRIPCAVDGFEIALHALSGAQAHRVVRALGEPFDTGIPALTHIAPGAARVAEAGARRLATLGVPARRADALATVARLVAEGGVRLEPGSDVGTTYRALAEIDGVGDRLATTIVVRALSWPDAFPASDRALQRAAGVSSAHALLALAERWRPWRGYAALHLRLRDEGR